LVSLIIIISNRDKVSNLMLGVCDYHHPWIQTLKSSFPSSLSSSPSSFLLLQVSPHALVDFIICTPQGVGAEVVKAYRVRYHFSKDELGKALTLGSADTQKP